MKLINFLRYRLRKFLMEEITLQDHIDRGMQVGTNCAIMDGSTFDYGHCNLITIGNNVTIAPQAYLLAHDASTKRDLGYTKIGKIVIEDNVFIGARALIMPNVTIGKHAVIAAGAVVTRDVVPNTVVGGNPAKMICTKEEYVKKQAIILEQAKKFDKSYTVDHIGYNSNKMYELQEGVKEGMCFLE